MLNERRMKMKKSFLPIAFIAVPLKSKIAL